MFDPASLLLFVLAGLALNLTPGPDLLYITARSLAQGWRAGAASAFGIAAGCLVHTAAAALGISLLLRSSEIAYDVLRLAGAAYLLYLGAQMIVGAAHGRDPLVGAAHGRDKAPANSVAAMARSHNLQQVFWQGFVTNVLNPKVALFFLAFLPQFADPARGSFALQIAILGAIFIFNGLWVCLAVARAAAQASHWIQQRSGAVAWTQRASGAVLVALGLHLAFNRAH